MRQFWNRSAIVAGMGLLIFLSAESLAQTDDDLSRAKDLFKQAEIHFSIGEFEQALELYRQSYKAKQLSAFLFNIAQCNRYLGRYKEATFSYKRYLDQEPGTPHRSQVEAFIKECEKHLAALPPPAVQPPSQAGSPLTARQPETSARIASQERRLATLLWSGVGVGGALLVGGTVTGIFSYSKNQESKDYANALGITSAAMLGLGGGILLTTGAFYLFYYSKSAQKTVSIAPMIGSDEGRLVLVGAF
jgi:tetratricopeptide (TPR) repeat protein